MYLPPPGISLLQGQGITNRKPKLDRQPREAGAVRTMQFSQSSGSNRRFSGSRTLRRPVQRDRGRVAELRTVGHRQAAQLPEPYRGAISVTLATSGSSFRDI